MSTEYHHNHYVPVWYQKGFLPSGQSDRELFYLDLTPGGFTDPRGIRHELSGLHRWGPRRCFAEKDLYTTYFGSEGSTEIEQAFFGPVDQNGKKGVSYFTGLPSRTEMGCRLRGPTPRAPGAGGHPALPHRGHAMLARPEKGLEKAGTGSSPGSLGVPPPPSTPKP